MQHKPAILTSALLLLAGTAPAFAMTNSEAQSLAIAAVRGSTADHQKLADAAHAGDPTAEAWLGAI